MRVGIGDVAPSAVSELFYGQEGTRGRKKALVGLRPFLESPGQRTQF
jgi:hypothetical protein